MNRYELAGWLFLIMGFSVTLGDKLPTETSKIVGISLGVIGLVSAVKSGVLRKIKKEIKPIDVPKGVGLN